MAELELKLKRSSAENDQLPSKLTNNEKEAPEEKKIADVSEDFHIDDSALVNCLDFCSDNEAEKENNSP